MSAITQTHIARWRMLIDNGRRTQFYREYWQLTGVDQVLETAAISQFSGALGGAALLGNAYARA